MYHRLRTLKRCLIFYDIDEHKSFNIEAESDGKKTIVVKYCLHKTNFDAQKAPMFNENE